MASSSSSPSPPFPSSSLERITTFPRRDYEYFEEAKIKVWWDADTAPIPPNVKPVALVKNIVKALRNAGYKGHKIVFWGRLNTRIMDINLVTQLEIAVLKGHPKGVVFPSRLCRAWSHSRDDKDGASRAILMDMFQSERRLNDPVNHLLISGHELFKDPLYVLKRRGHNILIARPSTAHNVFDYNIATTVWDWNELAEGKNPLSSMLPLTSNQECGSYAVHVAPGPSCYEHDSFCQTFIPNPEFGQCVDPVPYGYEAQAPYGMVQFGSYVGYIPPGSSGNEGEEDYNTRLLGQLNL